MIHLKYYIGILILASAVLFQACQKEEAPIVEVKEFPGVDEALWVFFERFETEAARRGFEVDLIERGITAHIQTIEQEHVGGVCNYHADHANEVIIDDFTWENTSELLKELVLFHELGHCYSLREHRDDAYDNGTCKSLMRSGLSNCIDSYNTSTRAKYLDELFDPDSVN